MRWQSFFDASMSEGLEGGLVNFRNLWDRVKVRRDFPQELSYLARNWVGYGISVDNPAHPSWRFYFNLPAEDNVSPDVKKLIRETAPSNLAIPFDFVMVRHAPAASTEVALRNGGTPQPGDDVQSDVKSAGGSSSATGTLGAVLQDNAGQQWILGANHVLAMNQPSPAQHKLTLLAGKPNVVEVRFLELKPVPLLNSIDAAVARWTHPVSPSFGIPIGSRPGTIANFPITVKKVGRPSGDTQGVLSTNMDRAELLYPDFTIVDFENVWLVEDQDPASPFSNDGDSGALVFADSTSATFPLGLVTGRYLTTGKGVSVVSDFDMIIANLNLATKDGILGGSSLDLNLVT